jgi:hypothetical protein
MPRVIAELRRDIAALTPIEYSDETAGEVAAENERWGDATTLLCTQLRSGNHANVDIAAGLNDFYHHSMAVMDCTRYTFPNLVLVSKLSRVLPLLPREYRQRVTFQDMTPNEIHRIERRIAKRFNMAEERKARKLVFLR